MDQTVWGDCNRPRLAMIFTVGQIWDHRLSLSKIYTLGEILKKLIDLGNRWIPLSKWGSKMDFGRVVLNFRTKKAIKTIQKTEYRPNCANNSNKEKGPITTNQSFYWCC
jgi:hypothetical protein